MNFHGDGESGLRTPDLSRNLTAAFCPPTSCKHPFSTKVAVSGPQKKFRSANFPEFSGERGRPLQFLVGQIRGVTGSPAQPLLC